MDYKDLIPRQTMFGGLLSLGVILLILATTATAMMDYPSLSPQLCPAGMMCITTPKVSPTPIMPLPPTRCARDGCSIIEPPKTPFIFKDRVMCAYIRPCGNICLPMSQFNWVNLMKACTIAKR